MHALQFLDVINMKDPTQKAHFYRSTLKDALPFIPRVSIFLKVFFISYDVQFKSSSIFNSVRNSHCSLDCLTSASIFISHISVHIEGIHIQKAFVSALKKHFFGICLFEKLQIKGEKLKDIFLCFVKNLLW